jgi:hypothetical protein
MVSILGEVVLNWGIQKRLAVRQNHELKRRLLVSKDKDHQI